MADFSSPDTPNFPASIAADIAWNLAKDDATDRDAATPRDFHGAHGRRIVAEVQAVQEYVQAVTGLQVTDGGGLDVDYSAGRIRVDTGAPVDVAASSLTLTDDDTNYVECDSAGTVSDNVVGFTAGAFPLATVVTSGGDITSVTDKRTAYQLITGANITLDGLSDVVITAVADNELLAYDNGSSKWINQTPAEAGLAGLADANTFTGGAQIIDGQNFEHQPDVGDLFKAGLGQQGQIALGASLDQDDVLFFRHVDGGSSHAEAGAVVVIKRDVTNVTSEDGRYLETQNAAGAVQSMLTKGGGAFFGTDAGSHSLSEASPDVMIDGMLEVDGNAFFDSAIWSSVASGDIAIWLHCAGSIHAMFVPYADDGLHLALLDTDGRANGNFIITEYANRQKNHGHGTPSANPTLFIHSVTDPESASDEWISLTHDVTDGLLETGSGDLAVKPASQALVLGDLTVAGQGYVHVKGDDDGDDDPGCLVLYDHDGTPYYLWVDRTGDLRIHTAAPADEDADGTVVGAQS